MEKMPSEHVRHLHQVLEPGQLDIGIRHGDLPGEYLRFWRCWEASDVCHVERALGMEKSSCLSARLEEDGDVVVRFNVPCAKAVPWIVDRYPPMTLGKC